MFLVFSGWYLSNVVQRKTASKPVTASWELKSYWCTWRVKTSLSGRTSAVAQITKKRVMLAMIEKCQSKQCIIAYWVPVRVSMLILVHPWNWNGHISFRIGPWNNGRRWPGLIKWTARFMFVAWRFRPGKETTCGQCDVLLQKPGPWHSCGCYFGMLMSNAKPHYCRPGTLFNGMYFGSGLYQQDVAH